MQNVCVVRACVLKEYFAKIPHQILIEKKYKFVKQIKLYDFVGDIIFLKKEKKNWEFLTKEKKCQMQ